MKMFIQKISAFLLILVTPFAIWFAYFGFPPPNYLSTSLSFNARCQFQSKLDGNSLTKLNVLAIGSSMTLNNLSTNSITQKYDEKYLNFSSWGQNVEEDFYLIKLFLKHCHPKTILMSSNYMDFHSRSKNINYNKLERYLFKNGLEFLNYKLNMSIVKDARNIYRYSKMNNIYQSLNFDRHGGVVLNSSNFKISPRRWKGRSVIKIQNINQYHYLDSIANFCNKKNISFFYVQSPFRNGWISRINDEQKDILSGHIAKVEIILRKYSNIQFINTLKQSWGDELFVDYTHLNNLGSKKYTDFIMVKVREFEHTKKK